MLKFLARENETGKMGSYETKVVIPDLSPALPNIKTSSVIWSSQRQTLKESLGFRGSEKELVESSDPFVQEGQKLIPASRTCSARIRTCMSTWRSYHPGIDAELKKPSVSATLSFYRGKTRPSNPSLSDWIPISISAARPAGAVPGFSRNWRAAVIPVR